MRDYGVLKINLIFISDIQAMKKGPLGAFGLLKGLKFRDLTPEGKKVITTILK